MNVQYNSLPSAASKAPVDRLLKALWGGSVARRLYQTRGSPLKRPPTGAWDARSCCSQVITLVSMALAGAATPARTERAIRADTIVFMAISKKCRQHHCRRSLAGGTIARCHDPCCYVRDTSRKIHKPAALGSPMTTRWRALRYAGGMRHEEFKIGMEQG